MNSFVKTPFTYIYKEVMRNIYEKIFYMYDPRRYSFDEWLEVCRRRFIEIYTKSSLGQLSESHVEMIVDLKLKGLVDGIDSDDEYYFENIELFDPSEFKTPVRDHTDFPAEYEVYLRQEYYKIPR